MRLVSSLQAIKFLHGLDEHQNVLKVVPNPYISPFMYTSYIHASRSPFPCALEIYYTAHVKHASEIETLHIFCNRAKCQISRELMILGEILSVVLALHKRRRAGVIPPK